VANERSLAAGLCGTSADAMKWFEGYRTLH